ncbi:MAG: ATP-binding protein [Oscillospiraceae bacterium]|nr:ATP-binding protein [Oscillospiraceae bacterium]
MKKRILTGAESFEKIIEGNYFYVDKTLFIKELLERKGEVTLITRPRRFGKTLNINMLEHFFDINKNSSALFNGFKITGYKDITEKHMNKYPVVSFNLKNAEEASYKDTIANIRDLIAEIYEKNLYLYESGKLNERQKIKFHSIFLGKSTDIELKSSLKFLTDCLYAYHKKRVIVLLDEYDTPMTGALMKGFYPEMVDFMRGFLGTVFKTNEYLEFGVLTGVQRISRESLFSSFNNAKVCGIMDKEFSKSFGFTEDEVKAACRVFGVEEKFGEVKSWYDGYRFGGNDMYNPWSITGYLENLKFGEYWVNTGSLQTMQDAFYKGEDKLKDELAGLLTGSPVMMFLEDGISYPLKYTDSDTFWTMLLNAGYIKPCNGVNKETEKFKAELVNAEIKNMFERYAKNWFSEQQPAVYEPILKFAGYLLEGDAEAVSAALNDELLNNPSSHDFKMENSYHMFIYGILYAVNGTYTVHSNPEAGKGRSDCVIKPKNKNNAAVIIEFKHAKKIPPGGLKQEAQNALNQIEEKMYTHGLKREGYGQVYKYGIAFHKKNCEVALETVRF